MGILHLTIGNDHVIISMCCGIYFIELDVH